MIENTIDGIKRNIDNDLVKYITYKNIKEWEAVFTVQKIPIHLGTFESLKEAIIAVQTAKLISDTLS